MLNKLARLTLPALAAIGLTTAAQAASYSFVFENDTGLRATRVSVMGAGEVEGFESMGRGQQTFTINVPDGTCRVTIRFSFNDMNGQFRRNYYDSVHNLCAGERSLKLSAG